MAVISKQLFDAVAKDVPCGILLHPGLSCFQNLSPLCKASLMGSAKFYSLIYVAQLLMQGGNILNKRTVTSLCKNYARTTITGILISITGFQLQCLMRKVLGYFSYNYFIAVPFALSGICMAFESTNRRTLITTLYFNLLIEYYLRCIDRAGYISMTKTKQVLMFMIGSSLLLYLMRLEKEKGRTTPAVWLINPANVRKKSDKHINPCPHDGECKKHIIKHVATYFGIGLLGSLIKLVPLLRTPMNAISSIRSKHFKLSSYIGIYQALICYYCCRNGHDSSSYAVPAGFAAGLSIFFNPNLMLSIAPFTEAFKLYSRTLYDKKIIPSSMALSLILFCLCQGILYNARFLDAGICPRYIFYISDSVSNKKTAKMYTTLANMLELQKCIRL